MAHPFPICMRDFMVKKVEVPSGPSLIKTHFMILENDEELGSLTSNFMLTLGGICSGHFLYRRWGENTKIAHCLYDAVKDIIDSDSVETVDYVCSLLFNIGLKL